MVRWLDLDFIILCVGNAIILIIGAIAWRRNIRSRAARSFFIATFAFVVWLTFNYLSIQQFTLSVTDLMTRLSYMTGVWLMVSSWYFCYQFPNERRPGPLFTGLTAAIILIGSAFSFSTLVVDSVRFDGDGVAITTGGFYALYGILLGLLGVASIASLWRNYAVSNLLQRNQIRYVAFGLGISTAVSITFNVIFVPLFGTIWGSVSANILVILPLIIFLGYGLIRHRYMDIHRIVSWLTTYFITFGLVGLWTLGSYAVSLKIYPTNGAERHIVIALLVSVALIGIQPLVRKIRRITDQTFNVGWYDSQLFLNEMGEMLAGENQISPLIKNSLDTICIQLGATSGQLIALNEKSFVSESFGAVESSSELPYLPRVHHIVVADELSSSSTILAEFNKKGWRVGVPLETRGKRVGYLFLGIKETGDIFSPKDIGVLQILSNQLAVAIISAQAFEQINAFNNTLQQQVNEATADLRAANDKLQVEDRMKTEFIVLTSHNLRTPISIIKGYINLLEDTKLDNTQTKMLESMKGGLERLSQFTEDLLAIDALVAGHDLILESTKLGDVLAPLIEDAEKAAAEKQLTLKIDISTIMEQNIDANSLRLRGAIRNVIDNAFKFTKAGSISISAVKNGNQAVISITDTGIGIADDEIPHLFTRFHRATSTLQYDYEGEGIGLYLSGLVIKEHGGTISVKSKLNKGSTFTISLPITKK